MYNAKVICDSIAQGVRLTTLEVTLPCIVLAELNTHRVMSRNSASSRAIPVEKRMKAIESSPFVPAAFAANKAGMQAGEELDERDNSKAQHAWLRGRDAALEAAERMLDCGVHKQWVNRLLEPFSWTTIVVTATEWDNFFHLRISKLAQPEIRHAAELMKAAMDVSTPVELAVGDWHLPYIQIDEHIGAKAEYPKLVKISTARCARVSYLTHDGVRDQSKDLELHDRLLESRHMSPFEHVAVVGSVADVAENASFAMTDVASCVTADGEYLVSSARLQPTFIGNFRAPWYQYRKMLPGEDVAPREEE